MRKSYEFQRIYYSFMSLYKRYEATKNRAVAISKRHHGVIVAFAERRQSGVIVASFTPTPYFIASKSEEPFDWVKPLLTENNYFYRMT